MGTHGPPWAPCKGSGRELQRCKSGVDTVGRYQRVVSALFDDTTVLQYHDSVGLLHRRQPVGNDQRRALALVAVQRAVATAEAGSDGASVPPKFSLGALSSLTTAVSLHTGQDTSPRTSWSWKSSSEANQPSKV